MPTRLPLLSLAPALASIACLAIFSSACVHSSPREPLRIGLSPDSPPMAFLENGELAGIEVTLGQMLSDALDRQPQWIQLEWQELIPALKADRIDIIMSGMSITDERAEEVLFSSPYMEVGQLVAIRWSDIQSRSNSRSMKVSGARIGVGQATTGESLVIQRFPDAQIIPFAHTEGLIEALRQGKVDFIVHDAPTIWHITAAPSGEDFVGLFRPLNQEYLAWAVSPEQPELKKKIDGLIEQWEQDKKLKTVFNQWIPIRVNVGP